MELRDSIQKDLVTVVKIREINHPVNLWEISQLQTPSDVLLHVASILSDVQEMLNAKKFSKSYKKSINDELNEAKYFIFKLMQFLQKQKE